MVIVTLIGLRDPRYAMAISALHDEYHVPLGNSFTISTCPEFFFAIFSYHSALVLRRKTEMRRG
jgi:hypothetical protein